MDNRVQTPSLLPFLSDDGGGMYLDILSEPMGQARADPSSRAFVPDYRGDPLSFGFRAYLYTDGGSRIKQLMLLVQRDSYPEFFHPSAHITNRMIDACWQRAFTSEHTTQGGSGTLIFGAQIGAKEQLLPFAPLFFCSKRSSYFHPPCSRCSGPLELCRDDELLEQSGLPHYSKSHQRLLYCPSCTPLHGQPWYARDLPVGIGDAVKDCRQLIDDFAAVRSRGSPEHHFPCSGCPNHDDCYGTAQAAQEVISVFSFYPFYLLATADFDLGGDEYLALVSGASPQELAAYDNQKGIGRQWRQPAEPIRQPLTAHYLYSIDDPRRFPEILYLKMQFLKRLAANRPGHYLSPAGIGVSLLAGTSVPAYWSCSITRTGLSGYLDEVAPSSRYIQDNFSYSFGLLWFVVLLSNCEQGETEIVGKLNNLLTSGADDFPGLRETDKMFHPCQSHWSPESVEVDSNWYGQWDEILSTGWKILQSGYRQEQVDVSCITQDIEGCLGSLIKIILPSPASVSQKTDNQLSSDVEIVHILQTISEKWRQPLEVVKDRLQESAINAEIETAASESRPGPHYPEADPDKTVIIPSTPDRKAACTASPSSPSAPEEISTNFDDTTIIPPVVTMPANQSPLVPEQPFSPSVCTDDPIAYDDLEETIRVGPKQGRNVTAGPTSPRQPEEQPFLEETVVIRKGKTSDVQEETEKGQTVEIDDLRDDDDFLTETVVLKPSKL